MGRRQEIAARLLSQNHGALSLPQQRSKLCERLIKQAGGSAPLVPPLPGPGRVSRPAHGQSPARSGPLIDGYRAIWARVRGAYMAMARRTAWQGLQAVAIAAERLQLTLSPSICSQLQQTLSASQLGTSIGAGSAWHVQPAWRGTPCTSFPAVTTAGNLFGPAHIQRHSNPHGPAHVRWHSTKPDTLAGSTEKKQQLVASGFPESFSRAGWTRQEVLNVPNGLSMLRLLSGPVIASWIVQGQWHLALPALTVSGATDWADGYVAKNYNQRSVLGSYLDPLADKTLMCSVIAAMGYTGALSAPLAALILGRDMFLVAGVFAARAQSLGWRWPGMGEFFRLQPGGSAPPSAAGASGLGAQQQQHQQQDLQPQEPLPAGGGPRGEGGVAPREAPAAPFVEPLYISKVNTCFQLVLVGACMARAWLGVPGDDVVWWVAASTAGTTVLSCAAYVRAFMAGNLLTAGKKAREGSP